MPPKKRAVSQSADAVSAASIEAPLTNLQCGNLYESRHLVPHSVCIVDNVSVHIGCDHMQTLDIPLVVSVHATAPSSCVVRSADKECTIAHSSADYRGFRISSNTLVLIFKISIVCLHRNDLSIRCEIPNDIGISGISHSLCLSEAHDRIVLISESKTSVISYGGGQRSAALHCSVRSTTNGEVVAEYEVPFNLVAYFSTTLRTYCHKDKLMISCWDDMQLKVVDLHSGTALYTLEEGEEAEGYGDNATGGLKSSVKCVACSDEYIAVGYEWQRYVKACPLRVYCTTTGRRLHLLAANGATPKCLIIHADQKLLFSCAENQREVKVWDLVSGTRRYTIPSIDKVVDIRFGLGDSLYVRSNGIGFLDNPMLSADPVATSKTDHLSVWKTDKSSVELLELFESSLPENANIMDTGKLLSIKKRRT